MNHAATIRPQSGFTLIEILVVVIIIAIVGTTVVLGLGVLREDTDLRKEAVRMTTLVDLAGEEALLQGREYGMRLTQTGYEFLLFDIDGQAWEPVHEEVIFRARTLPEGSSFELLLEGREIVLDEAQLVEDPEPQIMILSSGEFSPFEIRLRRDFSDEEYTIAGTPDGRTELKEPGEEL